jgi:acetyl esterase/lipase
LTSFSAGGHLTAWAATNFDRRAYEPADDVHRVSCRPDFAVLIDPADLVPKDKDDLAKDIRVGEVTPPVFLAHGGNDPVRPENSVALYLP